MILNDYNSIEYATGNSHTIGIVNAIKKLGAPIDAIGCQTHGADKLPARTLRAYTSKPGSDRGQARLLSTAVLPACPRRLAVWFS